MKIKNFILLSLIILNSCSQLPSSIEFKGDKFYGWGDETKGYNQEKKIYPSYVIAQPDQTLNMIAKANKVKLHDLMNINGLKESNKKFTQEKKLFLPNYILHKVIDGESVYQLSRKYGVTPNLIIDINQLPYPYYLKSEQLIKINITRLGNSPKHTGEKIVKERIEKEKPKTNSKIQIVKDKPAIFTPSNKFIWPAKGKITKSYGNKENGVKHDGINIKLHDGTPIKSIANGQIAYAGNEIAALGNIVIIKHHDNWLSTYGHQENIEVEVGQIVNQGEIIGYVGKTGHIKDSQLYFELRKNKKPVNPIKFLNKK